MTGAAGSTSNQRFEHTRILASAGSGKTYQLTNRYLALLEAGAAPASILASTFTRLAAGEIRDRVLLRLARAAMDGPDRSELQRDLSLASLPRDRVLAMLRAITRRQHELQIRTLDSFFAAIVRGFALELGLPPGCEVADQPAVAEIRREAIEELLDESDPQPLIDLLRRLASDAAPRSVTDAIDDTVRTLYELWRAAGPEAWDAIPAPANNPLAPPALIEAIQRLESAPLPDDSRFVAAHQAACNRAREWDWAEFLRTGLAKAIAFGDGTYYRKTIGDDLAAGFRQLIQHASATLLNRMRHRQLATRELLQRFDERYRAIARRRRALTFSEITHAVLAAIADESFIEIGYRLDATLHHLLLDEMQDTSISQWLALEPIVLELVSRMPPERTFFCVGDVKQSIYGWREACPDILNNIPQLLSSSDGSSAITTRRLATSYRSAPVVLGAVNDVFTGLTRNAALERWPDVAKPWQEKFDVHHAAGRAAHRAGWVELAFSPSPAPEGGEGREQSRLKHAAALVCRLHGEAPHLTIGVLTRTNKAAARLLYELGPAGQRLPASARGPGSITDAAPVNAMLDLLRLADHPQDTISAFNVAQSPLGSVVGLLRHDSAEQRIAVSSTVRRKLAAEGYAASIAAWSAAVANSCDDRELGRLMQLVSVAEQHDEAPSLRCDDFVRRAEASEVSDRGATPIQVMTVHQSKGLEFDVVVLPELDKSLAGVAPAFIVERDGAAGPIRRICHSIKDELRPLVPELERIHERDEQRRVHESLSLLYVAMTRAAQGLFMVIDRPKANERSLPKTLAGLLRSALGGAGEADSDGRLYQAGDEDWTRRDGAEPSASAESAPIRAIALRPDGEMTLTTRAPSPSAERKPAADGLSSCLALPNRRARLRGTIIHRLFQEIEWMEEFMPDSERPMALARRAAPRADQALAQQCVADFLDMLERPGVRALLSRGARPAETLTLLREVPTARSTDSGVQQAVIDRLVVERSGAGEPYPRAVVIDFKTDRIDAARAATLAHAYAGQMEAYRAAAAELLQLDPARVETVLLFLEPGVHVTVPPAIGASSATRPPGEAGG